MCYCPAKHFFGQSIKRGHFPKWNPYIYSGHPFTPFGGGQSSDLGQLLTKFRPLFIPVERALGYVAALCLILAGFLMYAFLREPRGSVYGWLPAAVIFLFNANTIAWLEFPAHQSVQPVDSSRVLALQSSPWAMLRTSLDERAWLMPCGWLPSLGCCFSTGLYYWRYTLFRGWGSSRLSHLRPA